MATESVRAGSPLVIILNSKFVFSGISTGIVPRISLLTPPLWALESVEEYANLQSGVVQFRTTVDPAGMVPEVCKDNTLGPPPCPVLSELYADNCTTDND